MMKLIKNMKNTGSIVLAFAVFFSLFSFDRAYSADAAREKGASATAARENSRSAGTVISGGNLSTDPFRGASSSALDSSAKYNYYIGEYYYNQGKFGSAEQYFRRSRDLIDRKHDVISERRVRPGYKGKTTKVKSEYTVGAGDTLHVSVWQNDDLSQDVTVRPDGMISFQLIGDVMAEGLTLSELKDAMTKQLSVYIKMPVVSISVKQVSPSKVIVLGQVTYPGVYAVSGRKTVLEAIALAGGFTNDAMTTSVVLVRGTQDNYKARRLSLNKALDGGGNRGSGNNIEIESEDIIFVPKKFIADINYFVNQILGPLISGSYNTQNYRNSRW